MEAPSKDAVKAARLDAGLSQREAAKVLYTNVRTWQNWEYGVSNMPLAMYELFMLKTGQYSAEIIGDEIRIGPICLWY